MLGKIVQGYGWDDAWGFLLSITPSVKYHATTILLTISGVATTVEVVLGIKGATALAFCVLALVELVTGIYASLKVRKEKYESFKIGRFTIKIGVILAVLYILNTFAKEFATSVPLMGQAFELMQVGMFAYSAQEYLVSVLENLAAISGKEKTHLLNLFKDLFLNAFNSFFKTPNKP